MIIGYKPGADITIMNTMYQGPRPGADNGQWSKPVLTIVYKDNLTGEKHKQEIQDPDYEYYMIKPDKRVSYNRLFAETDDLIKISVPYTGLVKDIATRTDNKKFFYDNINSGNGRANSVLHQHPDVFLSDMNIEDHYRYRFGKLYTNNITPLKKCFFDIEADTIKMRGDFPEMGECPVNAISCIYDDRKEVYTFLLRNDKNPQIAEFEKSVNDGLFKELKQFIQGAVGGPEKEKSFGLEDFKYNFLFYDEQNEIDLIIDLFKSINTFKPDFVEAWNMGFDIPYLIARIYELGYDPADIMCHPDFKNKNVNYFIDERVINEMAERGDKATISSYSVFLDQMIHFASRRKGQTQFASFSLDFIGDAIAGVKKLDYKDITTNISDLPYKNYKVFVFYNIMDTIVQHCIETKTQDLEYIFGKCLINNTRYNKGHRQTVYLTNRGVKEFDQQGFIMGNNCNRGNPPPETKFPGAFVANPTRVNNYSRKTINDNPVNLFDNLDDFDYAALYPSIMREFNMAPNTQIGMLIINTKIHDLENRCRDDKWSRAGSFMEDFQSHVWLEFCTRWLHLADYATLYDDVEEYFTNIVRPYYFRRIRELNGKISPIEFYGDKSLIQPVIFDEDGTYDERDRYITPDFNKMARLRESLIATPNQIFRGGDE